MKWTNHASRNGANFTVAGVRVGSYKRSMFGSPTMYQAIVFGSEREFVSEAGARSWVEESAKTAIRSMASEVDPNPEP